MKKSQNVGTTKRLPPVRTRDPIFPVLAAQGILEGIPAEATAGGTTWGVARPGQEQRW